MAPDPFTMSDVERLAARLDPVCAELDERERDLLHAVFAWAGQAVAGEAAEVEGFGAFTSPVGGGLAGAFGHGTEYFEITSFSFGTSNSASSSGGDGGSAGKISISQIIKP